MYSNSLTSPAGKAGINHMLHDPGTKQPEEQTQQEAAGAAEVQATEGEATQEAGEGQ